MTNSNPPPSSNSYLEQTVSLLSSVASYMRLPALASTVSASTNPIPGLNHIPRPPPIELPELSPNAFPHVQS